MPERLVEEETRESKDYSLSRVSFFIPHLITELEKIEGSKGLIMRLKRGEDSAYSEAILVTYFSKMGFEIHLEPVIETGRRSDVSVKVNSERINIEVKTPQISNLQKMLRKSLHGLFESTSKISLSRDIYIFLNREPSLEEQKSIARKTLQLALEEKQPAFSMIKESYVRTENVAMKPFMDKTKMIGRLVVAPPYPESMRYVYEATPILFLSGTRFDTEKNNYVNLTVSVPFEDPRLISMIRKKRRQLSRESMNIVALDTTHIPISPKTKKHYKWISRLMKALESKLSRRIGAVIIFSRLSYRDKIHLQSSLFVHPNPYRPLPQKFLDKCDFNSYCISNLPNQKNDF